MGDLASIGRRSVLAGVGVATIAAVCPTPVRALEADLRLAVQHCEFELHCQSLYNLAENRVTGFEALVPWNSPTRGQISPADFIPLAEQSGLIVPIPNGFCKIPKR